eukprot:gene9049-14012_t
MEMKMLALRYASNSHDLEDAYQRRKVALDNVSPELGTRVKVVHTGSRYNAEDFKDSFGDVTFDPTTNVTDSMMGVIIAKVQHFKKKDTEVFLVQFDNKKSAVFARKGFEVAFWIGCPVKVVNDGCKYSSKDFQAQFPKHTLVDVCRVGQKGIVIDIVPHYKAKNTAVLLVAIDGQPRCVIMNGKGCMPFDTPGIREYALRKEREEKAALEKEQKEGSTENDAGEKRK